MKNRFLFRGKSFFGGNWVVGYYYVNADGVECVHEKGKSFSPIVIAETISQCTGLLAAKSYRGESEQDRLVWEGDRFSEGPYGHNFVVKWSDRCAEWIAEYESGITEWLFSALDGDVEIVGTVHDTPKEEE